MRIEFESMSLAEEIRQQKNRGEFNFKLPRIVDSITIFFQRIAETGRTSLGAIDTSQLSAINTWMQDRLDGLADDLSTVNKIHLTNRGKPNTSAILSHVMGINPNALRRSLKIGIARLILVKGIVVSMQDQPAITSDSSEGSRDVVDMTTETPADGNEPSLYLPRRSEVVFAAISTIFAGAELVGNLRHARAESNFTQPTEQTLNQYGPETQPEKKNSVDTLSYGLLADPVALFRSISAEDKFKVREIIDDISARYNFDPEITNLIEEIIQTDETRTETDIISDENSHENPEQENIPDFIMVTIVTRGNVRSEASTNSPVMDSLSNVSGNEAKVIGMVEGDPVNGNSVWYRVEINGQVWFAHSSLFSELTPEQTALLNEIETKRLENQLFSPTPTVEPSGHAPQESGTLMVNSGGEYPWSNENWYPSEFTRIDDLVTQRKSDLLLALQQSGIDTNGVEISVGWNGKAGNELKISLFAFKQLDDGSFQVYWPKNETHSGLSYNSAVWPSYEFVTFTIPAGIEISYGFNDGNQNPYLLLKIDGQIFAALDTSKVLEAGEIDTAEFTSSVFWKYVEDFSGVMPENALQKLLSGEMSLDEFRELIKEMMPQFDQYTQENVNYDPENRTITINGQEYPVLYLQGNYNTKMEQPIYKGEQEPGDVEFVFTGIALETPTFEQHVGENGIEDSRACITVVIPLPSGQEVFVKFSQSLIAPGEGAFGMNDQYGNMATMDIQELLQIKPGQQVQVDIYRLSSEERLRELWPQTPGADPALLEPTVNFNNYFAGSAQQLYSDIVNGTADPEKMYEVGGFSGVGIYPPFTSN